jgi:predicted nucleotidyltransferase
MAVSRRELLTEELNRFVARLAEDPSCRRAILFGSLASGGAGEALTEASDIDLIVIQETDVPFWRRIVAMRRWLEPRLATDLLVYTPQEYEQLCRDRPWFCDEVTAKGRVVYERA